MTGQTDTGEPAFPSPDVFRPDGTHHAGAYHGMTLRQYAAIHLRYPDSGTEWLDDMIRQSSRMQYVVSPPAERSFSLHEVLMGLLALACVAAVVALVWLTK